MKTKKGYIVSLLVIIVLFVAMFCILNTGKKGMNDKEIIDATVDNFMLLAKVPRLSHHEEKNQ